MKIWQDCSSREIFFVVGGRGIENFVVGGIFQNFFEKKGELYYYPYDENFLYPCDENFKSSTPVRRRQRDSVPNPFPEKDEIYY